MRMVLILVALAACADSVQVPDPGSWYRCTSKVRCDGAVWELEGSLCADQRTVEAEFEYRSALKADDLGVKCPFEVTEIECTNTGGHCFGYY